MRIVLLTLGTRGDVQPLVALGVALSARGHDVVVCTSENHRDFVSSCGLAMHGVLADTRAFLDGEAGQRWLASGNVLALVLGFSAFMREHSRAIEEGFEAACVGADLIIGHQLMDARALTMADHTGAQLLIVTPVPVRATRAFPSPLVATRPLPFGLFHHSTHRLIEALAWRNARPGNEAWRARLGLGPLEDTPQKVIDRRSVVVLHAYSSHVVDRPPDWSPREVMTGWWALDEHSRARLGERVTADLERFLDAGPPPIYFGFGSMPVLDRGEMLARATAVAAAFGTRALVSAGWSDVAHGTDHDVLIVGAIDHAAVFPRCAAVVHHGGAGTTGTALTAGVPSLVCSVFADQPYWGARARALGVGGHVPFRAATAGALRAGLKRILDDGTRARASALGKKLRAEDGVGVAVAAIERHAPVRSA